MDDHNIDEGVKATPILKHNCEEHALAQQIDQTLPRRKLPNIMWLVCNIENAPLGVHSIQKIYTFDLLNRAS